MQCLIVSPERVKYESLAGGSRTGHSRLDLDEYFLGIRNPAHPRQGIALVRRGLRQVGAVLATNLFLMRQYFLTIPKDFEEAAKLDGAGYFKTYWRVMLPLAGPALAAAAKQRSGKSRRGGKIFVDYLRNAETASAVAAFSPRARKDAGVSTPVSWDELGKKDIRTQFTVKSVPRRLQRLGADPWADYAKTRQAITAAMLKALGQG